MLDKAGVSSFGGVLILGSCMPRVIFFAVWKNTLYNIPDDVADILEDEDVCVTGADGANAASSTAVAHACAGGFDTKKQMKLTSFFR